MYGKGRVFYSTLGHTEESWNDPDIRKMYFEAIRWALGMTDGSTTSIRGQPRARLRRACLLFTIKVMVSFAQNGARTSLSLGVVAKLLLCASSFCQ